MMDDLARREQLLQDLQREPKARSQEGPIHSFSCSEGRAIADLGEVVPKVLSQMAMLRQLCLVCPLRWCEWR